MNIFSNHASVLVSLAIAFALAASLTACGGGGGGESPLTDSTAPAPGSAPPPGTTPVSGSVGLQDTAIVSRQGEGGNSASLVAIDAAGNSIAVWIKDEGFSAPKKKELLARRYVAGNGWQAVEVLTSDASTIDFSAPAITMDAVTGKAMVAWVTSTVNGQRDSAVVARAYDPASGWAAPAIVKPLALNYSVSQPVLGTDPSGNVIAVWRAFEVLSSNLYANRYTPDGGWGTATLLTPENGGAGDPSLAFTPNGNGLVLFNRLVSNRSTIWGIQYTAGSGWGTSAVVVDLERGQEPFRLITTYPSIASDANGNAVAVWQQDVFVPGSSSTSGFYQQGVWAKRYTGGAWSADSTLIAPPVVCSNCPRTYSPIVKMNAQGLAAVTWITGITQTELDASSKVRVSRLLADGTWEALLANASQGASGFVDQYNLPDVGIDAQGNIRSVWGYKSIVNNVNDESIYTNMYAPGIGWGTVDLIENHPQTTNSPRIAVNARGNAMTVWQQFDNQLGTVVAGRHYNSGR